MTPDQPLAVQLYSVRELVASDRDAVVRRLAAIGYDAIEPYQPTIDPHGLRRLADELGLTIPSIHARSLVDGGDEAAPTLGAGAEATGEAAPTVGAGAEATGEAAPTLGAGAEAALDAAQILGARLVIVPAGFPADEFATAEGVARVADRLNALSARANARGLALGYHNHWWEIEHRIGGRHALEALVELLEREVLVELDVYWAALAGADVLALLRRLGPRVRALHLKDGPLVADAPQTALGRGKVPLRDIVAAAPGALRVVELDDCAGDVLEALAESRAYAATLG